MVPTTSGHGTCATSARSVFWRIAARRAVRRELRWDEMKKMEGPMMFRIRTAITMVAVLLFIPSIGMADVVLNWNAIMLTTIGGQNPFAQARFAAITQLAVSKPS